MKKFITGIFTAGFLVILGIIPLIIWAVSGKDSSYLFMYVGAIIFISLGYLIGSAYFKNREMKAEIEDLKLQNAAIAFSLSEIKRLLKGNDAEN